MSALDDKLLPDDQEFLSSLGVGITVNPDAVVSMELYHQLREKCELAMQESYCYRASTEHWIKQAQDSDRVVKALWWFSVVGFLWAGGVTIQLIRR